MAVFAELSSDLFFRDILRLELDIQAVLACDFDQVEFLADLRNNEAKIKPVSICDSDAFFCESIHKDPERIDFMHRNTMIIVIARLVFLCDIEQLLVTYSGNSEDIDRFHLMIYTSQASSALLRCTMMS